MRDYAVIFQYMREAVFVETFFERNGTGKT